MCFMPLRGCSERKIIENHNPFFVIKEVLSNVSGELLVDISSGPTLYQVLSGCVHFRRLIFTDFLQVNLQELRCWLQDETVTLTGHRLCSVSASWRDTSIIQQLL
uniref:Uncharacterized protein n=1 Tax=Dicentrarchus labrax TaxID=13489 RepID=A0A8C4HVL2_DICLA